MKSIQAVKVILLIFISSTIISFLYSVITNTYNGDFLKTEVTIPSWLLFVNMIFTIIPYILLWKIYIFYKKKKILHSVTVNFSILELILIVFYVYNVLITIAFGVGVMESEFYEAPWFIKIIIQIFNRFSFLYLALFYLFICSSKKKELLCIFMILTLGLLRAGLGSFIYIAFVLLIKHYSYVKFIIRRNKLATIAITMIFPLFVGSMFQIRSTLRNSSSDVENLTLSELIFGKLAGRLSSFSNSSMILQEPVYFVITANSLDNFYYQKQALSALIGGIYPTDEIPEILMKGSITKDYTLTSSLMTGTQGNLMLAFLKSPTIFFINILTIIFFITLTFKIIRLIKFKYTNELSILLLIYPITSGVSSEYMMILSSVFFFFIINLFFNALKPVTV